MNDYGKLRHDTPPEDIDVLVYINGRSETCTFSQTPVIAQWDNDTGWELDTTHAIDKYEVLGWRDIPEYDEGVTENG